MYAEYSIPITIIGRHRFISFIGTTVSRVSCFRPRASTDFTQVSPTRCFSDGDKTPSVGFPPYGF